jgi:hypothetical protein
MTKFEYISVAIPTPLTTPDNMDIIKSYGDVGWRLVCINNGFIYFERRYELKYG